MTNDKPTLLAVSSTGGHWEQLMLLSPAFEGSDTWYACTDGEQGKRHKLGQFVAIKDYNQNQPLKMLAGLWETFRLYRRVKPDVIISTGAAPGLLCLVWGRVFGAKTIWVDSVANSEQLSLSGRLALKVATVVYTQWEHLGGTSAPVFRGSIL
ncbi:hypothetical protein ACMU_18030 [Actibacterium mucosum KCTC 23349]|uniref:Glucuronosyltransferase n=1 Tax=Actibacterium mucosum KCTC 23349 TaxID=1454373 RepID=A0A037ZIE9_9RHOB|nr:hypothetical protein [Actibacterium mucosum]KAJ54605.1 hypothetical protein ACMU_18030 [Actibacterium mucosum KCTC 23349]